MASRSTRRKIMDHGDRIDEDFNRILAHLKAVDDLAEGRSSYIHDHLQRIVAMVVGTQLVVRNFTDGL